MIFDNRAKLLLLFICILILCNLFIGIYIFMPNSTHNIICLLLFQIFNVGFAYRSSELFFSLTVKTRDLPKLNRLDNNPQVALIYVTYNDAIPKLMCKLREQDYRYYDIYILDDSPNDDCIKTLVVSDFNIINLNFLV